MFEGIPIKRRPVDADGRVTAEEDAMVAVHLKIAAMPEEPSAPFSLISVAATPIANGREKRAPLNPAQEPICVSIKPLEQGGHHRFAIDVFAWLRLLQLTRGLR